MRTDIPRRYKAAYASSMAGEIRKNIHLEPGEEVLYSAAVDTRTNWLLRHPGDLELTSRRLILLEHHAFSPDWILEIPRSAGINVTTAGNSSNAWAAISYFDAGSIETVRLRPHVFRGHPSPVETGVLLDALRAFQSGELSRNFVESSVKRHEAGAPPPSYLSFALLALFSLVLFVRVGLYVVTLPSQWHAKQAYDASPDCNEAYLRAQADFEQSAPAHAEASTAPQANSFCTVQPMTVLRIWSTRNAPYQHVDLMDSRGRTYIDIGTLNSVRVGSWRHMRPNEKVYVLLAGDQPAWILHGPDLFETRANPDHKFWEQFTLMLGGFLFCGLLTALNVYVLRATILGRRRAALAPVTP